MTTQLLAHTRGGIYENMETKRIDDDHDRGGDEQKRRISYPTKESKSCGRRRRRKL